MMMNTPAQELADLALLGKSGKYDEVMFGVVTASGDGSVTVQPDSGEAVEIQMRCVGLATLPAVDDRVLFIRTRDDAYACLGTVS